MLTLLIKSRAEALPSLSADPARVLWLPIPTPRQREGLHCSLDINLNYSGVLGNHLPPAPVQSPWGLSQGLGDRNEQHGHTDLPPLLLQTAISPCHRGHIHILLKALLKQDRSVSRVWYNILLIPFSICSLGSHACAVALFFTPTSCCWLMVLITPAAGGCAPRGPGWPSNYWVTSGLFCKLLCDPGIQQVTAITQALTVDCTHLLLPWHLLVSFA